MVFEMRAHVIPIYGHTRSLLGVVLIRRAYWRVHGFTGSVIVGIMELDMCHCWCGVLRSPASLSVHAHYHVEVPKASCNIHHIRPIQCLFHQTKGAIPSVK